MDRVVFGVEPGKCLLDRVSKNAEGVFGAGACGGGTVGFSTVYQMVARASSARERVVVGAWAFRRRLKGCREPLRRVTGGAVHRGVMHRGVMPDGSCGGGPWGDCTRVVIVPVGR